MTCQIAAILMTLTNLEDHSPIAKFVGVFINGISCTVVQQLTRFQLTQRISGPSLCNK